MLVAVAGIDRKVPLVALHDEFHSGHLYRRSRRHSPGPRHPVPNPVIKGVWKKHRTEHVG
jgi:hypothetical protein